MTAELTTPNASYDQKDENPPQRLIDLRRSCAYDVVVLVKSGIDENGLAHAFCTTRDVVLDGRLMRYNVARVTKIGTPRAWLC